MDNDLNSDDIFYEDEPTWSKWDQRLYRGAEIGDKQLFFEGLKNGGNPNLVYYDDGNTPMHNLARLGAPLSWCMALMEHGYRLFDHRNYSGETPIEIAQRRAHLLPQFAERFQQLADCLNPTKNTSPASRWPAPSPM